MHGIIVQMPLDCDEEIDATAALNTVAEEKDVDGLTLLNQGKIANGYLDSAFKPCTPAGCLTLIESTGHKLAGSTAVVIGMFLKILKTWLLFYTISLENRQILECL